jgi:hypothetical protein|nr:MAG TPA: tail collar fiber protein [Caudoviricetes sp.]
MAKFNGFILTEKGRELLAKGLAGEIITFTKMAIGDGTSLTSERERTTLVNQITTLPILNINVKRNGTCEINALLTNKSVTTGFYIKELGIFAHGNDNVEILYAYNISTSPDFVPPFSANNVVEIEYVDTIIVDQVANVTAVIDPSITYITKKYADENYLVSSRLAEILGLEFGGNIQDIGNKTKGKFYYDSVTKFYYECIEDNSLTYNDSGKFRAISNKPLSDKVENLFKFGKDWVSFPNGLKIQWGFSIAQNGDDIVRLISPFKSSDYQVVACDSGGGTYITGMTPLTNETFKACGRDPYTLAYKSFGFRWVAIGY